MPPRDKDGEDGAFDMIYTGTVFSNADPERLYRVQVTVPGLIEPFGEWARPSAMMGGGSMKRGAFMIPKVGSLVEVYFQDGDPTMPLYYAGSPGTGEQLSHVINPPRGGAVAPADMYLLWGWEGERYALQVDERPGNEYFRILDKTMPENFIELDGKTNVTTVSAQSFLNLRCKNGAVAINGQKVDIQRRNVIVGLKRFIAWLVVLGTALSLSGCGT